MCGIVGYIGEEDNGIKKVLNGLNHVLYRGYDSIGIAFQVDGEVEVYKEAHRNSSHTTVHDIEVLIARKGLNRKCNLAIGHTRWATRGKVTRENAHPHSDMNNQFYVVHNGNVENFSELKNKLLEHGVTFRSETDTEVIANLLAHEYKGNIEKAVEQVMSQLIGANAIVVMCAKNHQQLIAANRGGSLLICKYGKGVIVASDPAAFVEKNNSNIILEDNEIAMIERDEVVIKTRGEIVTKEEVLLEDVKGKIDKRDYSHFMEKEIFEQANVLENAISGRLLKEKGNAVLGGIEEIRRELRKVNTFHFIGCGTAYNACCYGQLLFNRFGIPARAWIASEFCYHHPVFHPNDAFFFVSQSGETADTISVLEEIKTKGNICLGIANKPGTKIPRLTDAGCFIRAGLEIGVASTKAFTAQMIIIVLLAMFLARQRNMTIDTGQRIIDELNNIPSKVKLLLSNCSEIKELAKKYSCFKNYYFLGRYFSLIVAQEGALKLKEISYVHAESYPLGEMKHGPLALIEPDFCSVVIIPRDTVKNLSQINIDEIKSRGGPLIAITTEGSKIQGANDIIYIPETLDYLTPLLSTIPLQLFAYYMALELRLDPDLPRNLAKSVTVT